MLKLETNRHALAVAQTRSGKTRLMMAAGEMAVAAGYDPHRILVINPRHVRELRLWAEHHGMRHINPIITAAGGCPSALSAILREILAEGNWLILCDELQMVSRANDPDPIWRMIFQAGNGRGIAVWATSTRSVHIPPEAYSEATVMIVFQLSDEATLRRLAARGHKAAWFDAPHLGPYEFIAHRLGEAPEHFEPLDLGWEDDAA